VWSKFQCTQVLAFYAVASLSEPSLCYAAATAKIRFQHLAVLQESGNVVH